MPLPRIKLHPLIRETFQDTAQPDQIQEQKWEDWYVLWKTIQ